MCQQQSCHLVIIFLQQMRRLFLDLFSGLNHHNSSDRLNQVKPVLHRAYPAPNTRAFTVTHKTIAPVPPDHMSAWICKELSASGTVSITSHRPSAWRIPPLILLYSVELCAYSSPRIFGGACVFCVLLEIWGWIQNDSASWCSYCHGVTMAWVESQFIWLILCCCNLLCLSLL